MVSESNDLSRVWRFRAGWAVSLLLLTTAVIVFYTMPWTLVVRQIVVLASVVIYAIATLLVVFARCPRCGHLFHNVLGFKNPLSHCCSHCGLSLLDKFTR